MGGVGGVVLHEDGVLIWEDEGVLRTGRGDGHIEMWMCSVPLNWTL